MHINMYTYISIYIHTHTHTHIHTHTYTYTYMHTDTVIVPIIYNYVLYFSRVASVCLPLNGVIVPDICYATYQ